MTAMIDLSALSIRLELLRGFGLSSEGRSIDLPISAQRLLAFLALNERPVMRKKVAGVLWSDTPEQRAAANLRSSLWRVNQPGLGLVEAGRNHLRLAPDVCVDVQDFVNIAHDLLSGVDRSHSDLDSICLVGELLPDWYEDWVLIERERLRQLRLHALEALAERRAREGRYAGAAEAALAAVTSEPLRESAQRALIGVHIAEGNYSEALRQYRLYSELLFKEMGLRPSAKLDSMIESFNTPMMMG